MDLRIVDLGIVWVIAIALIVWEAIVIASKGELPWWVRVPSLVIVPALSGVAILILWGLLRQPLGLPFIDLIQAIALGWLAQWLVRGIGAQAVRVTNPES